MNLINNINNQMDGILEALKPTIRGIEEKEIFLTGRELELATKEAEEEIPMGIDDMDMTGADGEDDR